MNDEMMRKRLHTAMDECFSGVEKMPSQRMVVLSKLEGRPQRSVKLSVVPAFALVLALLLACAGIAAGLGLFGQLRASKEQEWSYTRLGHLEDAAVSVGQIERITIPGTEHEVELTIDQAYCDGRKLYYSYTVRQEASDRYHSSVGDGADLPEGTVLPNGADLPGGTYLNPIDSGYGTTPDGAATAYYEVGLPEGMELGETITFELTLMNYVDGAYDREKTMRIPVTVPVTGDLIALRGEGMLGEYWTKARLFVSDVDVSGTLEVYISEGDLAHNLKLVAGEEKLGLVDWAVHYGGEASTMDVRFDLPADKEGATYALVYDGEPGEALELTKGE